MMISNKAGAFLALLVSTLGQVVSQTIVEVAVENELTILVEAVTQAGLADTLAGRGPFTVFAPTDEAFEALPEGVLDMLLEPMWAAHLTGILTYHVLADEVDSMSLEEGMNATTVEGSDIQITGLDPVEINDSVLVTTPDVTASNGIVHVVDGVLLPPFMETDIVATALGNEEFSILVNLITLAGLAENLQGSGLTVFAPTNDAFLELGEDVLAVLELPENIDALIGLLSYHVLDTIVSSEELASIDAVENLFGANITITTQGRDVLVDGAAVLVPDVLASNGIIHAIDSVLGLDPVESMEPVTEPTTAPSGSLMPVMSAPNGTIVDIAVETEDLSILVDALTAAELVDALSGEGPFTVFAPNNDAFAAVSEDLLTKLLEEMWQPHLQGLLLYHVLSGLVTSSDLMEGMVADTLEGSSIEVTSLDPVQINEAEVVMPDVMASNGVIHVINEVLVPPFLTTNLAESLANFTVLVELVIAADLLEALQDVDSALTVFAPTDAAFEALGNETLSTLLLPENKQNLTDILLYHIVPGIVVSSQLEDGLTAETLLMGNNLTFSVDPAQVNGFDIIGADTLASNGVFHVIDNVLFSGEMVPTMAPTTSMMPAVEGSTTDSPARAPVSFPAPAPVAPTSSANRWTLFSGLFATAMTALISMF